MLEKLKKIYKLLPLAVRESYLVKRFVFILFWPVTYKSESFNDFKISVKTIKELKKSNLYIPGISKSEIMNYNLKSLKGKKNILVVDAFIPQPDKDSGSFRMYNLLKILLSFGYGIKFFAVNRQFQQPYVKNLQKLGVDVLYPPYVKSLSKYLKQCGDKYDVTILSRADVAINYIDAIKKYCTKAFVLFDTVDLQYLRENREAKIKRDSYKIRQAERWKKEEMSIAEKSDITLVVSHYEKEILNQENPNIKVELLSNIHESRGSNKSFNQRKDILFVGGFRHKPNKDAVTFLIKEIIPYVKQKLNGVKIYIVGSDPPDEVRKFASEDIFITGFVPDIVPYLNDCRISIAPLLWGAGVKGKINLSMSYGLPVVATPIAIEGMNLTNGVDVLVACDPLSFADAIAELYQNEILWNKLSRNGLENIKKYFSFEAAEKQLKQILNL
jgi:O-antigen biosynthesis protein